MKKLLLILTLSIALPNIAMADCVGGEEKPGKNGHVYCISNQTMNWWSAFAWCKANKRHLVTLDEACNNQSWSGGCTNMNIGISKGVWTAIASGDSSAYTVYLSNGRVNPHPRTNNNAALCY